MRAWSNLNVVSTTAIILVVLGVGRETRRAARLEAERDQLLAAIRDTFVPRDRYEQAAQARDRLEAALRDGFLPALQDASVANRESLRLIQAFQQEQAKLNTLNATRSESA